MGKVIKLKDKYFVATVFDKAAFDVDSFYTTACEPGVKTIVGKVSGKIKTYAYIFDKDRFNTDAIVSWLEEKDKIRTASEVGLLLENKTLVTANLVLCSSLPNLVIGGNDIHPIDSKSKAQAELNDNYYFYCRPVFEGPNLNDDFFFKDELVEKYRTMAHKPIDWEHYREQIVGFSLDSQIVAEPEQPVCIGINGVLNRLSPYMQYMEGEVTRDEIVRQRFFENKLSLSMEVFFDAIKCTKCGEMFYDFFEFEHHRYVMHKNDEDAYRGLVGIDFIGNGVVLHPAEPRAEVMSLRTSDDGSIALSISAAQREKHGVLAENIAFANEVVKMEPSVMLVDKKYVVTAKKDSKNNTKSMGLNDNKEEDKNGKKDLKNRSLGGDIMFKLAEKISAAKCLGDIFVIAHQALKDYCGGNKISEEDAIKFGQELNDVVVAYIASDTSSVEVVYGHTKEDKMDAISKTRGEEKALATQLLSEKDVEIATAKKELEDANAKVATLTSEIESLKRAEIVKQQEQRVATFMQSIHDSGVVLTEFMQETVKGMAFSAIDKSEKENTDPTESLSKIHDSIVATFKQTTLAAASGVMGDAGHGSNHDAGAGIDTKLDKLREQYKKSK
ncbi:hypothetical protein M0R04_05795 [Candidatus Dojkabacteria bacterium]|jgi:hypothetical protein|nr:hypothetical protein [Candidatus Dojkabacteria bacterium]